MKELKTLREWIEDLKITPVKCISEITGNTIDAYKSEVKKDCNGYIDIYTKNCFGLLHKDIEKYLDKKFFIQNSDINNIELIEKFWQ